MPCLDVCAFIKKQISSCLNVYALDEVKIDYFLVISLPMAKLSR